MSSINIVVESDFDRTIRVRQLEAMFDVPPQQKLRLEWHGELPVDTFDWNVGLIVGPSGSGKSTILKNMFGEESIFEWNSKSVIDDFDAGLSIEEISRVCQSVGFNTIPAWMRAYDVLSTGEKFRATLARHLLSTRNPIVMDEFTSVVDRQVAQIGAFAVQKWLRKNNRRFVAATCHYDVIDWLQPDWMFEPATMTFTRRSLQQRPAIQIEICRVEYKYWRLFAPFHYLTNELNRAARCFALFANGHPASFGAMLYRPHPRVRDVMGLSRLVTLPDWQGLGLAMVLSDTLGAAYKAIGKRMHVYPAHPSLIHAYDHSPKWKLIKLPGTTNGPSGKTSTETGNKVRLCATFCYSGDVMDGNTAQALIHSPPKHYDFR